MRSLCGVLASELITIACGIVTIVKFKSLYCIWYCVPLLLKLVALVACVERTSLEREVVTNSAQAAAAPCADPAPQLAGQDPGNTTKKEKPESVVLHTKSDHIVCEVKDFSCGFFLVDGPKDLILQFF